MLLASFALSQLAALPDAVAAVWLKMLGEALLRGDRRLLVIMALALGLSATATWFLLTVSTRVQRRFRDKVTIALEAHVARLQAGIATIAHQERPGIPRPPLRPARPGLRPRPHVHVALLHLRLDPAPRGGDRAVDVDPSRARAPGRVRAAHRVHLHLEARRRAHGRGARRAREPARAAPLRDGHDRGPGQGGARHADRRAPGPGAARGLGALVRARGRRARHERRLARAGLDDLRRRLRRRDRVRVVDVEGPGRRRAARARRGLAPLRLHRRDRGRDRLLARDLARRVPPAGLARGLRGVGRGHRRPAGAGAAARGHPARGRVVRLPRHRAPRPRVHRPRRCPRARWSRSSARTARARARS